MGSNDNGLRQSPWASPPVPTHDASSGDQGIGGGRDAGAGGGGCPPGPSATPPPPPPPPPVEKGRGGSVRAPLPFCQGGRVAAAGGDPCGRHPPAADAHGRQAVRW